MIYDKPKTRFGKWFNVLAYYINFVNVEHKKKLWTADLTCIKYFKHRFAYIFMFDWLKTTRQQDYIYNMSKNGRFKAGKVSLR